MFALVEDGKITQMPKGNKGITLGDNQYPASIYTLWTEAERNAIGIYTVEIDTTNKKDEEWYINTNITYAFTVVKLQEHMAQLQQKLLLILYGQNKTKLMMD
jgi:hypothetical protein